MASLVGRLCSSIYWAGSRRVPALYASAVAKKKGQAKPIEEVQSSARAQLNRAVTSQLKVEREELEELPTIEGFKCSMNGAVATFEKPISDGEIQVVLDANAKAEMDLMNNDQEEEEDIGLSTVPAFTVTVKSTSGSSMQLEYSFDTVYDEDSGDEDLKLLLNSVTMIPKGCEDSEVLYTVDAGELGEEIINSLEKFMDVHGIDHQFGADLLSFFNIFDHKVYVRDFLENLEQFSAK